MDAFTGYIYSAMWLIIAVYLFFTAIKESKFFFLLSGFFLFLSGWYLADELITTVDLFSGVYSWIFRGVALAVLVISAIAYLKYRKKRLEQDKE